MLLHYLLCIHYKKSLTNTPKGYCEGLSFKLFYLRCYQTLKGEILFWFLQTLISMLFFCKFYSRWGFLFSACQCNRYSKFITSKKILLQSLILLFEQTAIIATLISLETLLERLRDMDPCSP